MPALRTSLAGVLAALALAAPARAEPPVWIVSDHDSEMVLFGSVHLLPPDLDWWPAKLTDALKTADDLWFESPVGQAAEREASAVAYRIGALPAGRTLSSLLPKRDRERLRRVAARYDVPLATIDRLQPWLAEAAIVQAALARQYGAYAAYSVEAAFDAAAPASARRRAFATSAEHMAMLAAAPVAEQVASLRRALRTLETDPRAFDGLVKAWARGDAPWLLRHVVEPERREASAQFRRLVTERNAAWTRTLDARLKGQGRTVVVVGVGHLIGPEGLPAQLRALGYSVTGP